MKKIKFFSASNGRVLRSGAFATGISVLALAAVVLVNVIVRAIPTKNTEFDLSESGIYTLSEASEALAASLAQKVEIYYLAQSGSEDSNVTRLLDRYAGAGANLHWSRIDPAINPTFANQYGGTGGSVANGSVIVVCGEKNRVVDAADLYEYDYSNYYYDGSYSVSFDAENAIDAAILYVSGDETKKVCQTTGHGETALNTNLAQGIERQNLTLESVNLLSDGIPEDTSVVVVNNPTADFSTRDIETLKAWLDAGGSLMVTTDPSADTPNLDALLAEYGMSRVEGIVVEADTSHCMQGYNHYLLPNVESTGATNGMANQFVLAPIAQGIDLSGGDETMTRTALLSTSSVAYSKLAGYNMQTYDREDGDLDGPFTIAASVETESGTKIVWANFGSLTDTTVDGYVAGGNTSFYVGCVSWMTGSETVVIADSKSMQSAGLVVNGMASGLLGMGYIIVLPLALLVAGIAVTVLRRRK